MAAFFAVFAGAMMLPSPQAYAQNLSRKTEVWMGGGNPLAQPKPGASGVPRADFFQMFEPNAPWQRTAEGVKVMKLPPALVLKADKATLSRIFADLDRRHIALAIEAGWLHGPNDQGCGKGVEGFAHSGTAALMGKIVKAAGGDLKYVAMDEPLVFGYAYKGNQSCHFTMEQTAQLVAEGVAEIRAVFPTVQIGDIEAIGLTDPTWPAQIRQWVAAYRAATHTPLAFLHADIQWSQNWQQQLGPMKAIAHQAGMPFGIIYDGVGNSDAECAKNAVAGYHLIEANPQWKPDQPIFQSWQPYPTHMLPENKPGTSTNLALRYLEEYKLLP